MKLALLTAIAVATGFLAGIVGEDMSWMGVFYGVGRFLKGIHLGFLIWLIVLVWLYGTLASNGLSPSPEFVKAQFDKLLVTFFLLIFVYVTILTAKWFGPTSDVFKWATNAWVFFTGLLGGLITGYAYAVRRASDTKNGGTNAQTVTTTGTTTT